MENKTENSLLKKDGVSYLVPFILITSCFALWGFANDITNPMVEAFSRIFRMSVTEGTLVQVAFYGGYFCMAFPAAMFIKKRSYKAGILMGLGLYAVGALMFFPAKMSGTFYPFLLAYFILTCGLSFLETSANPFILSMGCEENATRRLNMAQSFNPLGSISGMFVAMFVIQANLDPMTSSERANLTKDAFEALKEQDLSVLIGPYLFIAAVIAAVFLVLWFTKIPYTQTKVDDGNDGVVASLSRLIKNKRYVWSVVAQFFYVGVQIMCWTFIIQYGKYHLIQNGIPDFITNLSRNFSLGIVTGSIEKDAATVAQFYNICAMASFIIFRFVCTYLMKYFTPAKMLLIFGSIAFVLVCGVIGITNGYGLYCLILVSSCMSLMFPTIYGIGLKDIGRDAEYGAAGLIMSILGGSVLPPLQAAIMDAGGSEQMLFGMPSVNVSFIVPLICFIVIIVYSAKMMKED